MRKGGANVRFADLCGLLVHLGFVLRRVSGSHHVFRHEARRELMVNVQSERGKAKPCQVKQVLDMIDSNGLEVS
jgi:predicted RNA binding protein YcfA (HicA-like mRNA interferase family)